jgi:hypothetical protein
MRNAYGSVLDVVQLGKPSRVEDEKIISQAVFLPIEDGRIEEGDLLGVINVYYVGVTDFFRVEIDKKPREFSLVCKKGDRVERKKITSSPLGFKRNSIARWECLISDEDRVVKRGEPIVLKIKDVKIPKNTFPYQFSIARHAFGATLDVYAESPEKVEEGFVAKRVVFMPLTDGTIRKGELVGIINLYSIEIASLEKVQGWLNVWIDEIQKILSQ